MIRLTRRAAAAAAIALLGSACASTGQGADSAVAGCYYFEQDRVATSLSLPWGVRLLDRSLEGWPALQAYEDARVATTLTGQAETDVPFGYWRGLPADSVLIGYPAGGGLSLRLAPTEAGLAGIARAVGDATLQPPSVHPVRLIRARCPEDA